jgi:hypothetical protein
MPRPANQPVHTPGAPTSDVDDGKTNAPEHEAHVVTGKGVTGKHLPDDRDAEIAKLKADLRKAEEAAVPKAGVVYEPVTPNGKLAREASQFGHLTSKELMAEIDAGNVREPLTSVLCADGYYAPRVTRKE